MNNNSASQNNSQNTPRKLRQWQELAIRRFFALLQRFFLITATPGGGKTEVASHIAQRLRSEKRVRRFIIVVPTNQLKRQWATQLARFGIHINTEWKNNWKFAAPDYDGVAVTYAQVSANPEVFDLHCGHEATFLILDEIHHGGDGMDWGESSRIAFDKAKYILCLSGTPFRSDGNPIPFVRYVDGKSKSDYSYGYGAALADGVVRSIFFPVIEGEGTWIRRNGIEVTHSMLDDDMRSDVSSELLRVMLSTEGNWLSSVIKQGNEKLTEFRQRGHAAAAGLIIATDQSHARRIAKLVERETGEEAVVVVCDDPRAANLIKDFAHPRCRKRWIIAVKMVSEGIDLPNLRVGIYATPTQTEMFFRQVAGRFVRVIPGLEEQEAVLYLPAVPTLIEYALAIKTEREHCLARNLNRAPESVLPYESGSDPMNRSTHPDGSSSDDYSDEFDNRVADSDYETVPGAGEMHGDQRFTPDSSGSAITQTNINCRNSIIVISTEARFHNLIADGQEYTESEWQRAQEIADQMGAQGQTEIIAAALRLANQGSATGSQQAENSAAAGGACAHPNGNIPPDEPETPILTLDEEKKILRENINRLVNKLAWRRGISPDVIHREWISTRNGKRSLEATKADLENKLEWIKSKLGAFIREAKNGSRS